MTKYSKKNRGGGGTKGLILKTSLPFTLCCWGQKGSKKTKCYNDNKKKITVERVT